MVGWFKQVLREKGTIECHYKVIISDEMILSLLQMSRMGNREPHPRLAEIRSQRSWERVSRTQSCKKSAAEDTHKFHGHFQPGHSISGLSAGPCQESPDPALVILKGATSAQAEGRRVGRRLLS